MVTVSYSNHSNYLLW